MTKNLTVLHVDDEPDALALGARVFGSVTESIQTLTATTGEDGLRLLEAGDVDCIISDTIFLADGEPFAVAARRADPDVPIVLFTGKEWDDVSAVAAAAEADEYVRKAQPRDYELVAEAVVDIADPEEPTVRTETHEGTVSELRPTDGDTSSAVTLEGGWTVIGTHDWRSDGEVALSVIEALESHTGLDAMNLQPLFEVLDPDAMTLLLSSAQLGIETVEVRFPHSGLEVAVTSDGSIAARPLDLLGP